jgi:hypothetical protein
MFRRAGVVLVWVLATMVATAVALAAVRSVAGQVVDSPGSPLLAAATSLVENATTTTLGDPTDTTLGVGPTSTTSYDDGLVPGTTPSSVISSTTSTTLAAGSVTSSTAPPATTPTTATTSTTSTTVAAPVTETRTYQLIGGWVRIAFSPGVVTLDGANPNPGFTMEIEKTGPNEVELDFRSDDHRSEFTAEWKDGVLDVGISEEAEDD